MNNSICRKLIYYPITFARGEKSYSYLKEVKNAMMLNEEELNEYQKIKMNELIYYVNENILFYKKMFKRKGLNEKNFKKLSDLTKIDLMSKNNIKKYYHELENRKVKRYLRSTSGTTGSPLKFQKDTLALGYMDALMYEAYSWHGVQIGDRQGRIWGSAIEPRSRIIQRIVDLLMNRRRLSTFNIDRDTCKKFKNLITEFKVQYLYGYVNGLYEFAETMKRLREKWKLKLKCIIVTGEVLFEHQRNSIEEYFGTRVVNEYGTTENGVIAFECEHKNMHVMPTVYLEIIKKDLNGDGEIVVTELNSRSLPFIRYKVGDIGRIKNVGCACGRQMPILELKRGRIDSYIKLPDGKLVYDAILAYSLKNYAIAFRGYQKELEKITIELVPNGELSEEKRKYVEKRLRKYLGNTIKIEFIVKGHIRKEKSGKLRYFIPMA